MLFHPFLTLLDFATRGLLHTTKPEGFLPLSTKQAAACQAVLLISSNVSVKMLVWNIREATVVLQCATVNNLGNSTSHQFGSKGSKLSQTFKYTFQSSFTACILKDKGMLCFHRCLSVSQEEVTQWSLIPSLFQMGGGGGSPVTGPCRGWTGLPLSRIGVPPPPQQESRCLLRFSWYASCWFWYSLFVT